MPRSPADYLIKIQKTVFELPDKNGTRLPAFNDPLDAAIARYAFAKTISAAAEKSEEGAKKIVRECMSVQLGIIADGAPAMNVYASTFTALNAEKRGRTTVDSKKLIANLTKIGDDNPKIKQLITNAIDQSKVTSYALYLTPTLNAMPE